jgi:ABC-type uncharacterized transport system permease subunit
MLSGVTLTCFSLSYLIVLLLESTRLVWRIPYRMIAVWGMLSLGLFTHAVYMWNLGQRELLELGSNGLLSSWHDWSLLAAFGLAITYTSLLWKRPDTAVGTFILPIILSLIALSWSVAAAKPFPRSTTVSIWGIVHGSSLLVGTMVVSLGFAVGLMYLVHAHQLKQKRRKPSAFRLPSLEYLQSLNRSCLYVSTLLLALGFLSGIILNLNLKGKVGWTEGGVLVSLLLFAWLVSAIWIDRYYHAGGPGRRVAYLTMINFSFLVSALLAVVATPHGREQANTIPSIAPNSETPAASGEVSP